MTHTKKNVTHAGVKEMCSECNPEGYKAARQAEWARIKAERAEGKTTTIQLMTPGNLRKIDELLAEGWTVISRTFEDVELMRPADSPACQPNRAL